MKASMELPLLSVVAAVALVSATCTVLVLEPQDRVSIKRGCALTALGFVFFPALFAAVNAAALRTRMGASLVRHYRLSIGDVMDINNKLVSAVQALLCVVTGAIVTSHSCSLDLLHASHFMSDAYAWFGAAYFFYDIWSMYQVHIHQHGGRAGGGAGEGGGGSGGSVIGFWSYCRHEPIILGHHLFIGGFGFLTIVYLRGNLGDCVFGFAYLMELSTPFVSARGILSRLKMKETRMYVYNGLCMLATFFVCRVAAMPYVCLMYSRHINKPYFEAIQTLPTGCKISISILLFPQVYWFYLMSRGAVKVFLPKDKAAKLSSATELKPSDKIEKRS